MTMTETLTHVHDLVERTDLLELAGFLSDAPLPEVSELLDRLPAADAAVVFRLLSKDTAIDVFERLEPAAQADLITELGDAEVVGVFEALDPDDVVGLLDELPAKVTKRFLRELSPRQRRATAPILGFPQGSIGRRMTPEYLTAHPGENVATVLERVRRNEASAETIYVVPVVDASRTLVGIASLRDLLRAEPEEFVHEVMNAATSVVAYEDDEAAARRCLDVGLIAMPVVDREERLIGLLTIDDAVRIIRAAEDEDRARAGGHEPLRRTYLLTPILSITKARGPWLLVLAISAILTVQVLHIYEAPLEELTTLALFIPLLTGTGGNTGSQAATTLTRAIAMNEIGNRDVGRVAFKELRTGFSLGIALGTLGFVIATLVFGIDIGTVIGLTLLAICTMSAVVGGVMPIIAKLCRVDPAVFSTPFISTFCDATGLIIYFSIAKAILGL
ncbi:magnesium transporter [Pseudactinotalea sp. HY158]|uniref:magnesium transporter n=1 Tax=Pseudactinotalea sp. HY158 TaxID=2654547 RepID=UPI00129CB28C|nr:magnesium transporter [Pseudactinotalea sp. HY158]QGH70148.1 magnesium transporter [Pseudactinotalea sp. HY158]